MEGIDHILELVEIQDIQQALGIGRILDATLHGPHSAFDMFGVSMLELDGDDSITDVATPDFTYVEGASDPMDPPLSFDSMSRSYLDVFAWSYEDMSGLDPSIVQHHLPILPHARLVKQKLSRLHPRWSLQKDDKVRVCVDFRDLNKASPKDDLSLPHIDMLVDSTTGHSMLSFMDGFSGIEVDPEKIRAILDMPALRTEREIRGFLGSFSASHTKAPSASIFVSFRYGLGCMLAQLDDLGRKRAIYYLKFDIQYVTYKSMKGSIIIDHLFSLPIFDDRPIDDNFPDDQFVLVTSIAGWHLSVRLAFFDYHRLMNNVVEHETCITCLKTTLDLGVRQLEIHWDSNLVIQQTQGMTMRPLLIKTRSAPTYCCLIGNIEDQVELPWYHDIHQFLAYDAYLESATTKDKRALRQLPPNVLFVGMPFIGGVCGPHMGSHMLARKIMRADYFWLTTETYCCQFIQRCTECQMHGDLIHVPPFELHALTSPWPFSVETASYASLTAAKVAKLIRSYIIYRYGIPHELISDRRAHFRGEVDTLVQEYEKLPFALWACHTSFRTSIRATPFSLVYSMEAVLPVEIEVGSLRIDLEHQIVETN
ncbi:hypothetical protein CK203_099866 [Vitis vinifera]|uniref:Integrase zinc-binding domain-containing protein n=1 Tax=Vitis vinifera TaxID=29760 RepID=A0A438DAE1_VITVI|nr:hypothetical protein CK203_099866 [Vitis vinifera]